MKQIFTTGQVAKICKVAPRTVSKWFDSGRLKGYRIPGAQDRRIPRDKLVKFLKDHGMPLGELEADEQYLVFLVGTERSLNTAIQERTKHDSRFHFEYAEDSYSLGHLNGTAKPDSIVMDGSLGRSVLLTTAARIREKNTTTILFALVGEDEANPDEFKAAGFNDVYKYPFDSALLSNQLLTLSELKYADD